MKIYIPEIHNNVPNGVSIGELQQKPDDSMEEIDLQDCLDFLQSHDRMNLVTLSCSKLKDDGVLKFHGLDSILLGKTMYLGVIQDVSMVLYNGRQSISHAMNEINFIKSSLSELSLTQSLIDNQGYFLEWTKNKTTNK